MNDQHSPLELPDASLEDKDLDRLRTLRKVRDALAQKGVPVNVKPDYDIPEVPPNLSEISERELGDLYARLLAWDNYFSYETALAESEAKEAKNILTLTIVKLTGGEKKRTHEVDLDERVKDARAELQEAEQTATLLKRTHSIFSNKLKVVSRTIELRKIDLEKAMRGDGIASTKRGRDGGPVVRHSKLGTERGK